MAQFHLRFSKKLGIPQDLFRKTILPSLFHFFSDVRKDWFVTWDFVQKKKLKGEGWWLEIWVVDNFD